MFCERASLLETWLCWKNNLNNPLHNKFSYALVLSSTTCCNCRKKVARQKISVCWQQNSVWHSKMSSNNFGTFCTSVKIPFNCRFHQITKLCLLIYLRQGQFEQNKVLTSAAKTWQTQIIALHMFTEFNTSILLRKLCENNKQNKVKSGYWWQFLYRH